MAGSITHAIFGKEVLRQLEDEEIRSFLENNMLSYLWGLQGPDPYFTVLKGKNGMIGRVGMLLHLKDTERSFEALGRYLLEHQEDPMFESLLAFGMGYLGHYALDKKVHQFVFPRDKAYQKEHPEFVETHNVYELHGLIERGLEWQIFACKQLPGETAETVLAPYNTPSEALYEALDGLFVYLAKEVYNVDATETSFTEAAGNMTAMFDKRPSEADVFMEDHLNLYKVSYEMFDTPGEYFNQTLFELYDEAKEEHTQLLSSLYHCVKEGTQFAPGVTRDFSCWRFENFDWIRDFYQLED